MRTLLTTVSKFLAVPLVVVILIIIGYFVFDPFKILYPYDSYSHTQSDRDYYSIEMFKNKYDTYHYDSFIFGSSRTLAFLPSSWKTHLPSNSSPYMLDGFGDNIYGIYHKVKYLDSLHVKINNTLVVFDVDETFTRDYPRDDFFFYLKHPDIDGSSWKEFYKKHFIAYFNPSVIVSYYANRFFGIENKFIYNYIGGIRASVDSVTNELRRPDLEREIQTNTSYYDNQIFYSRADTAVCREPQLTAKQYSWLKEIRAIFDKQNTDYRIVIGPMYSQSKFDPSDIQKFNQILGENRIYDFSGVNEFTKIKQNYYETSHYRPLVGDSIMNYIYSDSK